MKSKYTTLEKTYEDQSTKHEKWSIRNAIRGPINVPVTTEKGTVLVPYFMIKDDSNFLYYG